MTNVDHNPQVTSVSLLFGIKSDILSLHTIEQSVIGLIMLLADPSPSHSVELTNLQGFITGRVPLKVNHGCIEEPASNAIVEAKRSN